MVFISALTLGPDDNRIHAYALGDWKTDKGVMNFNIAEPLPGDRTVNVGRIEFWT